MNLPGYRLHPLIGKDKGRWSVTVNGKSNLTPEMAVRIAKATNTSPESWINMQIKLDLWEIEQNKIINTVPFKSHVA